MGEEFTLIGYKANELLYYWRGTYWRWTRSPMTKDDPPHVFEELKEEHADGWTLEWRTTTAVERVRFVLTSKPLPGFDTESDFDTMGNPNPFKKAAQ